MCGRYAAAKDTATLVEEFQVETVVDPAPGPNYNVAPTNQVAFVVDRPIDGSDGLERQLRVARWGLVPSWAKDPKIGSRMINARWENAAEKPAFRSAFAKRRCLIPADGYFEWYTPAVQAGVQSAAAKPRKQPYFIHRGDGAGLALAGLYEFWRPGPEEDWLVTVTVLTTDSIGPLAAIHDRMPVMIEAVRLPSLAGSSRAGRYGVRCPTGRGPAHRLPGESGRQLGAQQLRRSTGPDPRRAGVG